MPEPVQEIAADTQVRGARFALVVARFNAFITARLEEGAREALARQGARAQDVVVARVPGAFELPLVARALARSGRYQAVIALGCVIRGDTPHFEYVAGECARGLSAVALETGVPVSFGVLTVETVEQAIARARPGPGNKGAEAALCAIEMANLLGAIA